MQKIWDFITSITQNKTNFIFSLVFSSISCYFTFLYNAALPKPETPIELMKYYFISPGDYLLNTGLNLLSLISLLLVGISLIYFASHNGNYYKNWFLVLSGLMGIGFIVAAAYFFSYFILLLFSFILLSIIVWVVIWALSDSKSYR
ncbi:hypothetical protein ABW02_20270 [Niallia circulans]|uniref:Uncharacterized protein n=1 Tax=Niallia circulans TaxID=1397 RepID=A0A0J1L238_NIACI|nr:hypothetical protein [Niallia circulans]KLV23065.1 hypothetical protein ABW02_20270 [Niallia circulans]